MCGHPAGNLFRNRSADMLSAFCERMSQAGYKPAFHTKPEHRVAEHGVPFGLPFQPVVASREVKRVSKPSRCAKLT